MSDVIPLPSHWVPEIIAHLHQLAPLFDDVHREKALGIRPSEEQLRTLLDTSFFASILQEEGRPSAFRLAFIPWEKMSKIRGERFVFEEPLSFSPQQLTKLAPAVDVSSSYIAVEPAKNGSLQIWGIIHTGIRPLPDEFGESSPGWLTVAVRRQGVLTIRNSYFSFRYAMGRGVALEFIGMAWKKIDELILPLLDFATLRGIGASMLKRGHGGAVFVIPTGEKRPSCIPCPKYSAETPCNMLNKRKESAQGDWGFEAAANIHQGYAFVGSLAAVDGAVLLNSRLEVLGFGLFVKDPQRQPLVSAVLRNGQNYDVKQRGARHRSALWFCETCPNALALVVSQDGDACLFVRKDGEPKIIVEADVDLYWSMEL